MTILTDTIGEYTSGAGVTIDGFEIRDGGAEVLLNLSRLGTNTLYVDPKGGGQFITLSAALTAAALLTPSATNEILIVVTGEVAETAQVDALSHVHVLFLPGASVTATYTGSGYAVYCNGISNSVWAAVDPSRPNIIRAGAATGAARGVYMTDCNSTVVFSGIYSQNVSTGFSGSYGFLLSGGSPTLTDCTGAAGGTTNGYGWNVGTVSRPTMTRCTGIGGDGGTGGHGFYFANGARATMTDCVGVGGAGATTASGIYFASNSGGRLRRCTGIGGGARWQTATATIAATSRQEDTFRPTASQPWMLKGISINISAAAAGGVTLQLFDATGGGGNALSAAVSVASTGTVYIPVTGNRIITAGSYVYAYLSASDATLAYTISYEYEVSNPSCYGLYNGATLALALDDCLFISNGATIAAYIASASQALSVFSGGIARSGKNDAGRAKAMSSASSWNPAAVYNMTLDGGTANITAAAGTANGSNIEV